MTKKTIPIDELKLGMFMVGVQESWLKTPFFLHRRLISQPSDIALLKQYGIQKVIIDPTRGLDVESSPDTAVEERVPRVDVFVRPAKKREVSPEIKLRAELAAARMVRAEAVAAIERIFEGVKTGVPLDYPALRAIVTGLMDLLLTNHMSLTTVVLLQQLRRCDGNLFEHSVDVSVLALVLGHDYGLDTEGLEHLGLGGILHDIGKLRLPHNLLRKSGLYTAQEQTLMRMHPQLGAKIVAQVQELDEVCRRIVMEHHEALDGSGFPQGLSETRITVQSQIVGLVDRYEALATSRGGRPAMFPAQAVRELYQLGISHHYDRALVERMIRCLGVYPVGSLVELNTKERGVVIMQSRTERLKPIIKLLWAEDGRPYAEPEILDLTMRQPTERERSIKCVLDPAKEQVNIAACIEDLTDAPYEGSNPGKKAGGSATDKGKMRRAGPLRPIAKREP